MEWRERFAHNLIDFLHDDCLIPNRYLFEMLLINTYSHFLFALFIRSTAASAPLQQPKSLSP